MIGKRGIGNNFEDKARAFLETKGYKFLDKNFYHGRRELDLIMQKDNTIIFIEVKYRATNIFGGGHSAVNKEKMRRMSEVAEGYIISKDYKNMDLRFDLIVFTGEKIDWVQDILWGDEIGL
ncbi:MAG: YraN family protein [Fusobacteriaceae bacterium]